MDVPSSAWPLQVYFHVNKSNIVPRNLYFETQNLMAGTSEPVARQGMDGSVFGKEVGSGSLFGKMDRIRIRIWKSGRIRILIWKENGSGSLLGKRSDPDSV